MNSTINIFRNNRINRIVRRTLEWQYRRVYHNIILRKQPKILCNSFPKSGTHLLVGLVSGLPQFSVYGRKVYKFNINDCFIDPLQGPELFATALGRCLPGEVFRGHVAAEPEIIDFLQINQFKHIFIYRDLRDVVVSLLFWWKKQNEHKLWPFRYFTSLNTDDERICFLIQGWPENPPKDFPPNVPFSDIGTRFLDFYPWLTDKNSLALRFEDLLDEKSRARSLARVVQYLAPDMGGRLMSENIRLMELGANPQNSKTYRTGKSGEWSRYFSDEHKDLFKSKAGKLLIDLGYEKSEDW